MLYRLRQLALRRSNYAVLVTAFFFAAAATVNAGNATPRCVCLKWTAPGDDGSYGTASFYDFRYSTLFLTSENWITAQKYLHAPLPLPAGTEQQLLVTGLNPGTTYHMALKSADERWNWSLMSNVVTVTTSEDVCVDGVGNVDCDPEDDVNVQDLVVLADYLFLSQQSTCVCLAEADIDPSEDGQVNILDLTTLVRYLFTFGVTLPECP